MAEQTEQEKRALAFLAEHEIAYERFEHPALFTYEAVQQHAARIPGVGTKNLFLRNREGTRYFLVVVADGDRVDLRALAERVGEKKLLFGNPDELKQYLGVEPGSVSLLGVLNDEAQKVLVFIDRKLLTADRVHLHPNINTCSLVLVQNDFQKLTKLIKNTLEMIEVPREAEGLQNKKTVL